MRFPILQILAFIYRIYKYTINFKIFNHICIRDIQNCLKILGVSKYTEQVSMFWNVITYIFHIKGNWMMEATRNKSERLQIERFQLIWNQDKDKMYLEMILFPYSPCHLTPFTLSTSYITKDGFSISFIHF